MATKLIIETFQEYFSISSFGRKHQASFYNVLVLHKLYKVCATQGHDGNCIPGSQKFLSFFHQNSIWICWDVGVKVASDFQTSSIHNCLGKVAQIARKHLSVRWRKSATGNSGVALLRDSGCTWCSFLAKRNSMLYWKRQSPILKATKFSDHLHVIWTVGCKTENV